MKKTLKYGFQLSLFISASMMIGCSTIDYGPPAYQVHRRTAELGELGGKFLECRVPKSLERQQREADIESEKTRVNIESEKKGTTVYEFPTVNTLGLDDFRTLDSERNSEDLKFQVRYVTGDQIIYTKIYKEIRHVRGNPHADPDVNFVTVPNAYSYWTKIRGISGLGSRELIHFWVKELAEEKGVINKGTGRLGNDGELSFNLRPYLQVGANSPDGLTFQFQMAHSEKISIEVFVPKNVFQYYQ